MFDCPFCMGSHPDSVKECPDRNVAIPPLFVNDINRGVPVINILTIGYKSHGKTCFLSSLFHTLFHGEISRVWPGFTLMGLNMETLNRIHTQFVNPLGHGELPAATAVMFPEPLLLRFQNIPIKHDGLRKLFFRSSIIQRDAIFVFYDVGGETYGDDATIRVNLPILKKANTLLFLIDLPALIKEAEEGELQVVDRMHKLLNTVCLYMEQSQMKKKKLIIGFTKTDLMWGKEDTYGPLSKKVSQNIPPVYGISNYLNTLESYSQEIEQYLLERYALFYNLCKEFNSISCVALSSLGSQPRKVKVEQQEKEKIDRLAPSHVLDPLLWTLRFEKHL